MSKFLRAPLPALPALLIVAAPAGAATPTPAPPIPVVTAISSTSLYNFGNQGPFTISGRNFASATAVHFGDSTTADGAALHVDSDNTITIDPLPFLPPSGPYQVTVSNTYGTSSNSIISAVDALYGPLAAYNVAVPVTCDLGGAAGAQFDATLKVATRLSPTVGQATGPLERFGVRLFVPHSGPLTNNPLGIPGGSATATGIDVDVVTAAGTTSRDLLTGSASAPFPFAYTGSDNPMEFRLGGAGGPFTGIPADAAVVLKGYHASVPLTSGGQYAFDCTPQAGKGLISGTLPDAPTPPPVTTPPVTTPPVTTPPVTTPPVTTPPVTTPPHGDPAYSYTLAGNATLKTLTKGALPLSGSADAKLNLGTGQFSADLKLAQTTGNLVAIGVLPVTAKVAIVPQSAATGTLADGKLTVLTKVRIKLPSVTLFGLQLAGGAGCQAKNVTSVALTSVGDFDVFEGGSIAGTFTISDLVNCGGLTGLVSPLTAGSGNAIALKLTPKS